MRSKCCLEIWCTSYPVAWCHISDGDLNCTTLKAYNLQEHCIFLQVTKYHCSSEPWSQYTICNKKYSYKRRKGRKKNALPHPFDIIVQNREIWSTNKL